jgi:hypothetical protein
LRRGLFYCAASRIRGAEIRVFEKTDCKKHAAVDADFPSVGLFNIPNKDELEAMIPELAGETA